MLPLDRPRTEKRRREGGRTSTVLAPELASGLRTVARRHGTTLSTVLLAGLYALLHRYGGDEDIRIGVPVAGRQRAEIEGLVGFFVNTLVVRADLTGQTTIGALIDHVRDCMIEAQTHQDVPFEKLVSTLQPQRSLSHSPLFQVIYNYQTLSSLTDADGGSGLAGLIISGVGNGPGESQFDLSLSVGEGRRNVDISFGYTCDVFDEATIVQLAEDYAGILRELIQPARETLPVGSLKLLSVKVPSYPEQTYPFEAVMTRIDGHAFERPGAVAVTCEGEEADYALLVSWSSRIGRRLHGLGVLPDERVGLCVTRSVGMIAGLLGILRAGGAYVPLDAAYPRDRLALMIGDSGLTRVVVDAQTEAELGDLFAGLEVVRIEDVEAEDGAPFAVPVHPDQLAYVIYTSGSTGTPKGVGISHRALNEHLGDFMGVYRLLSTEPRAHCE